MSTRPHLIAALADLVLPVSCVGCGGRGSAWCPQCLPGEEAMRRRTLPGPLPVLAAASYEASVRAAVLAWKERQRGCLARPMAGLLAGALATLLDELAAEGAGARVVVVPIPTSRANRRARGGDLLAGVARSAAARCAVRPGRGALLLTRDVRDSAGLSRRDRAINLQGAFRARPAPAGTTAVLVDDVVTTGATLTEAALALRAAGWTVAGAACVASTPRPVDSRAPSTCRSRTIVAAQPAGLAWGGPNREGVIGP